MAIPQTFPTGFRLIDGNDLNNAISQPQLATNPGLTAKAGGGISGATALQYGTNQVTTVASAADSVLLPPGLPGAMVVVRNSGANAMQVFARGSDTINGTAGATGISQANAKTSIYFAVNEVAGVTTWVGVLSA